MKKNKLSYRLIIPLTVLSIFLLPFACLERVYAAPKWIPPVDIPSTYPTSEPDDTPLDPNISHDPDAKDRSPEENYDRLRKAIHEDPDWEDSDVPPYDPPSWPPAPPPGGTPPPSKPPGGNPKTPNVPPPPPPPAGDVTKKPTSPIQPPGKANGTGGKGSDKGGGKPGGFTRSGGSFNRNGGGGGNGNSLGGSYVDAFGGNKELAQYALEKIVESGLSSKIPDTEDGGDLGFFPGGTGDEKNWLQVLSVMSENISGNNPRVSGYIRDSEGEKEYTVGLTGVKQKDSGYTTQELKDPKKNIDAAINALNKGMDKDGVIYGQYEKSGAWKGAASFLPGLRPAPKK